MGLQVFSYVRERFNFAKSTGDSKASVAAKVSGLDGFGSRARLYSVAKSGVVGSLEDVKQMDWIMFLDVYDWLYLSDKYQAELNKMK